MTLKRFLPAGVAALALFAGAQNANAATGTLTMDAVIIAAITVNCGTPLDFGNLDASAGAGTVTVTTAGARSSTNPGNEVGGGSPNAGVCAIDGADGLVVDVNIPDDQITSGATNIPVQNYSFAGTGAAGGPGNDFTITLPAGAASNYNIGGDLVLAGTEPAGTYTGTVTVTVTYQ